MLTVHTHTNIMTALSLSLVFTIERREPELIAPAKPTPYEFKNLSDLDDQKSLRDQLSHIQFYQNTVGMEGRDPLKVVKAALAEALVYYYPFAGRLRERPNRTLVVECTGEGVLFIEANADVRLDQFGDTLQPPFPCAEDLLYNVPGSDGILHCPLLLIQMTRLKCGGFIFASRLNHIICDATGLLQFLTAVTEISLGASAPSVQPVWQRELLLARDQPQVSFKHHAYEKLHDANEMTLEYKASSVNCSFAFNYKHLASLRKYLPPEFQNCSIFDILSAVVWRCRTIALDIDPTDEVRVAWYVNARTKFNPPLPSGFYGNVIGLPIAFTTAAKLLQNPISYAVALIRRAKDETTEEFMRSTIDFLVKMGRPGFEEFNTHMFYVSDLRHIGFKDMDFGWGKPKYGGIIEATYSMAFYQPWRNNKNEEGVLLTISLPETVMERFAEEIEKTQKCQHDGGNYSDSDLNKEIKLQN